MSEELYYIGWNLNKVFHSSCNFQSTIKADPLEMPGLFQIFSRILLLNTNRIVDEALLTEGSTEISVISFI